MPLPVFLRLIRVADWSKNFFVLLPAFFGGRLFLLWTDFRLGNIFIAFCLLASAVYIVNDICDREADRLHPEKRKRPLASGEVSEKTAWRIAAIIAVPGIALAFFSGIQAGALAGGYLLLNLAYSFWLKRVPVLDLLVIASGFTLRVMAGSAATGVTVSHWLYTMSFLLSLGIALGKRYDDLLLIGKGASGAIRSTVAVYDIQLVRISLTVCFAVIFIAYTIYTCSEELTARLHSRMIFLTAIPALGAVTRYLYVALRLGKSGDPVSLLLRDHLLQLCILAWAGAFTFFLYLQR